MNKQETAEVVVIGGGVIGTATAYYLACSGVDTTLVERGEYACGTSKRCDGHAVTYDSPPGYFSKFCKLGLDLFPQVIPELCCDIQFVPEGIGLLVDDELDMETVVKTCEGKKKEGIAVELWDKNELKRHEPNISDAIIACLNFTDDAKLNPMRLTFGLAELAQKNGAKMHNHVTVTGFSAPNGKIQTVHTDSGTIKTNKVVLAAGVWTPLLGHMLELAIPIRPRQGQILLTERLSGLIGKNYAEYGYLATKNGKHRRNVTPAMEKFGVALVLEPSAEGTVLVGSSRRFAGMDIEPHPAVMQAIAQRVSHFFPRFRNTRIIRAYAGLRPASPDGKPIISPTTIDGVYVASGHEGNGLGLSLITGLLVRQMLSGAPPAIELEPLRLDRFNSPTT